MAELCHDNDALLIFDEVQTGVGMTGTMWAYEQMGVVPDIVVFGKKTQVCGIMAGRRLDELADNVFTVSSRLNSTWGGNLTDMVRARRIFEVIERDRLVDRARLTGAHLLSALRQLADRHPQITDVRGRGLMCAIDLPSPRRTQRRPDAPVHRRARPHDRNRFARNPFPATAGRHHRRARRCGRRAGPGAVPQVNTASPVTWRSPRDARGLRGPDGGPPAPDEDRA